MATQPDFQFDWSNLKQKVALISPEGEEVEVTVANAFDLTRHNGFKTKPVEEPKPAPVEAASIPGLTETASLAAAAAPAEEPAPAETPAEPEAPAEEEKPKAKRGRKAATSDD